MKKCLALTKDRRMTYCTAPEDKRGKGRCNHVIHQNANESIQDFISRINKNIIPKEHENEELVDIVYLKEGLNKLDRMMSDADIDPITIKAIGGFCIYSITNETTRDINSLTKLSQDVKGMVGEVSKLSNGKLESNWLNDDSAYSDADNSLRATVERYLLTHPEEFEDEDCNDLSKLQRIKVKRASNDTIICLKYAAIKDRIKAKDVNDLTALVNHQGYGGKELQRTLARFGINVNIVDLASDLYMMGILKTEDEYLDLIKDV